jgi:hypothetical protein
MEADRLIVICPYCNSPAEYVDSIAVYRQSYGMIYLCRPCNAYVGVHKGTDKPLGRLADHRLRYWKKTAHAAFDPLWRYGPFRGNRSAAYTWLADRMGLTPEETHIGMFDIEQCQSVCEIAGQEMKGAYQNG